MMLKYTWPERALVAVCLGFLAFSTAIMPALIQGIATQSLVTVADTAAWYPPAALLLTLKIAR